jgi:N-dimethylarginine dimethylaminohydrolase
VPGELTIEKMWLPHQEVLRRVVERRSGCAWADELQRQVFVAPAFDHYAQGARELLSTLGLAIESSEIAAVIERAWGQD